MFYYIYNSKNKNNVSKMDYNKNFKNFKIINNDSLNFNKNKSREYEQ